MLKSRTKIKYLLTILLSAVALLACTFAVWGFNSQTAKPTVDSAVRPPVGANATIDKEADLIEEDTIYYTFGDTYKIDGTTYRIYYRPDGAPNSNFMPYATALTPFNRVIEGFNIADYSIVLKSCFHNDGIDYKGSTGGVRSSGTYTFELTPTSGGAPITKKVVVNKGKVKFDVNKLGDFGNATSWNGTVNGPWAAHGEITTIYQLDDGWYDGQLDNRKTVNTKVVTNATYAYSGNPIPIMLTGEIFEKTKEGNGLPDNVLVSNSKYVYDELTLDITDRAGLQYTQVGEYVATFTFSIPEEYKNDIAGFDYSDPSILSNSYKCLSIPKKTQKDYSFELEKHWFIIKSGEKIRRPGYLNGNEPYVPFSVMKNGVSEVVDTITFGDNVTVNEPDSSIKDPDFKPKDDEDKYVWDESADRAFTFSIDYKSTDGNVEETIREDGRLEHVILWTNLGNNKWSSAPNENLSDVKNTLAYYLNSSMPAGTYTLTITSRTFGADGNVNHTVAGTYTLYVLPAELDPGLVSGINTAIKGENGINYYTLENDHAPMLHKKLTEPDEDGKDGAQTKLEKWLNGNVTGDNFWAKLKGTDDWSKYYDDAVVLNYRRSTDGVNNYNSYENTLNNLTSRGEYTFYYSVSARNYVTTGGAEDNNRENYSFKVKLYSPIPIYDDIRNGIKNEGLYFKDVAYTGESVLPVVPDSAYYFIDSEDKPQYINVGYGYVTLTLYAESDLYGWGDVPNDLVNYVTKDNDKSITIRFNIVAADNAWSDAPWITSWLYYSFNSEVNTVKSTPKFKSTDSQGSDNTVIYYRLGKAGQVEGEDWLYDAKNGYSWLNVGGSLEVDGDDYDSAYFAVDGTGKIVEGAAKPISAKLNALHVGDYSLDSYIFGILKPNSEDEYNVKPFHTMGSAALSKITVIKGFNSWTVSPVMTGWTYNDFSDGTASEGGVTRDSNFTPGEPQFVPTGYEAKPVTYTLHAGGATGEALVSFNALTDSVPDTLLKEDGSKYKNVTDYLNNLNYGNYAITAKVEDTSDYYSLTGQATFSVSTATNIWTTYPSIEGWVYGRFTTGLLNIGATTFGAESKATYTIQYANSTGGIVSEKNYKENLSYDDLIKELRVLSATGELGDMYNIRVTVPAAANNNYGAASPQDLRFKVSKADYEWKGVPTIADWVYGEKHSEPVDTGVKVVYRAYTEDDGYTELKEIELSEFTIDYSYFYTEYIGGVNTPTNPLGDLKDATVGTYMMKATVSNDTANFNNLVAEVTFRVTVNKNDWKANEDDVNYTPEERLEWIWGWPEVTDVDHTRPNLVGKTEIEKSGLLNATPIDWVEGIIYTITKSDGTYSTTVTVKKAEDGSVDRSKLKAALYGLNVGTYTVALSVAATSNYEALNTSLFVVVYEAEFKSVTDPKVTGEGWTWGDIDKEYKDAAAVTALETDQSKVTYSYSVATAGATGVETPKDLSALTALIYAKPIGTYTVTVTISCPNYKTETREVKFTVSPAQFKSVTDPTVDKNLESGATGWIWGSEAGKKVYTDVSVVTVLPEDQSKVTYSYSVATEGRDGLETPAPNTLEALRALIYAKPIGTYTVYVTVKCPNYVEDTREVTFTITPAKFTSITTQSVKNGGWTWGAAETDKVYTDADAALIAGTAGTIKRSYRVTTEGLPGAEEPLTLEELTKLIYAKPIGTYTIYVELSCDNYTSETLECKFVVSPAKINVANESKYGENDNKVNVSWAWGAGETAIKGYVPDPDYFVAESDKDEVEVTYAVMTGSSTENPEEYGDLITLLTGKGENSYVVIITVSCTNYTTRTLRIDVTVIKASFTNVTPPSVDNDGWTWGETGKFNDVQFSTVQDDTVKNIDKPTVTYRIYTGPTSEDPYVRTTAGASDPEYVKMLASLYAKNAGTYSVTVLVECEHYDSLNYTVNVQVKKGQLAVSGGSFGEGWTWGEEWTTQEDWTWTAGAENNHYTDVTISGAKSGEKIDVEYRVMSGTSIKNTFTDPASMMAAIRKYDVGSYSVTVTVSNVNYDSASTYLSFTVAKAAFTVTAPQAATWSWGTANETIKALFNEKITVKGASGAAITVTSGGSVFGDATLSYYIVLGNSSEGPYATLDLMLAELYKKGVNTYKVQITASNANYETALKEIEVKITEAEFTVDNAPYVDKADDAYAWIWGNRGTNAFHDAEVQTLVDGDDDKVSYEYRIYKDGATSYDPYYSYGDLTAALYKLGAGKYQVVVIVSCENYKDKEFTVEVNIEYASFTLTAPDTIEWTWREEETSIKAKFEGKISATGVGGSSSDAKISYRIGNSGGTSWSDSYETLDSMFNALKGNTVGSYLLEVSATNVNYTTATKRVTVTVKPAAITVSNEDKFDYDSTDGKITWAWGAPEATVKGLIPEPLYSVNILDSDKASAAYSIAWGVSDDKSSDYPTFISALMDKGVGTYTVTITISCENYTPWTASVEVTVSRAEITITDGSFGDGWTWGDSWTTQKDWTWTAGAADNHFTDVTVTTAKSGDKVTKEYRVTRGTSIEGIFTDPASMMAAVRKYDAGTYSVYVTASNDNSASASTILQLVIKAANFIIPEEIPEVNWNWTDDASLKTFTPVKVETVIEGEDVNKSYRVTKDGILVDYYGGFEAVLAALQGFGAGNYILEVTVTNKNYNTDTYEIHINIAFASFSVEEQGESTWVWGVAEDDKVFNDLKVTTVNPGDAVNRSYRISIDSGVSWTGVMDYSAMLSTIRKYGVGTYLVEVTVTNPNYTTVIRNLTVTVTPATITVDEEKSKYEKKVSWVWGAAEAVIKDLIPLTVYSVNPADAEKAEEVYGIRWGVSSESPKSYGELITLLMDKGVGTYTVTITITCENYSDWTVSIEVTVSPAKFTVKDGEFANGGWIWGAEWTTQDGYTWQNGEHYTDVVITKAKVSDVVTTEYRVIGTGTRDTYYSAAEMMAAIKSYAAGSYTINITISNPNYETAYSVVSLLIQSAAFTINAPESATWSWGTANDTVKALFDGKITVTGANGNGVTVNGDDTLAGDATLSYRIWTGTSSEGPYTTLNAMLAELYGKSVNTYRVEISASNSNYGAASKEIAVSVTQARFTFTSKPAEHITWVWGNYTEDKIAALTYSTVLPSDKVDVTYRLYTGAIGSSSEEPTSYEALVSLLKNKPAGTYNFVISISGGVNYIPETVSGEVVIEKATFSVTGPDGSVSWTPGTTAEDIKTKISDVNFTGEKPSGTTVTYYLYTVIDNEENGGSVGGYEALISQLSGKVVGSYRVSIMVACDNYKSVEFIVNVTVGRIDNEWVGKLEDVVGVERVNTDTYTIPSATTTQMEVDGEKVDVLRFDIIPYNGTPKYNLTSDEFKTELGKLVSGTFTVYARLGGDGYYTNDMDEKLVKALAAYRASYKILETQSALISLNTQGNGWTNAFEGGIEWTYGATYDELKYLEAHRPVANLGDSYAVYTIKNGSKAVTSFSATSPEYDTSEDAWKALVEYLVDMDAGTYSITAFVEGTDEYAPASTISAVFTVHKVTTEWTDATASAKREYTWNYDEREAKSATELHKPEIKKVTEKITSIPVVYTLAKAAGSSIYSGNDWDKVLEAIKADTFTGAYTLTAIVVEGKNYTGLENDSSRYTATITISATGNSWKTDTVGEKKEFSWTYNGGNGNKTEEGGWIIDLVPTYNQGALTLSLSGTTVNYGNSVAEYLAKLGAGTYTIKVDVPADDKYGAMSKEFTLTIFKAANSWKSGSTPEGDIDWTYYLAADNTSKYISLNALHEGTISYTVNGSPVELGNLNINTYLEHNLKPNDLTRYTVMATLVEKTGNYEDLVITFNLLYQKATNTWNSSSTVSSTSVTWTYDAANNSQFTFIPTQEGTISFTVGGNVVDLSGYSDNINTYFKTLGYGDYNVRVTVVETKGNYKDLTFDFTLHVDRAENTWEAGSTTDKEITWVYGASDNKTISFSPKYKGSTLTYTVGVTAVDTDINEYLKQNVSLGNSVDVVVRVAEDAYYKELTFTFKFTYAFAANYWEEDSTTTKSEYSWKCEENNEEIILSPKYLKEELTVSYGATTVKLGTSQTVNNYLKTLGAGRYEITVTVADPAGHYNTLIYTFTLNIAIAENYWEEGDSLDGDTVTWTYKDGEKYDEVKIVPHFLKDKLVIVITSSSGSVTLSDKTINDYLKELPYGDTVYNISATVAADGQHTGLTLTFTFQKPKAENGWSTNLDPNEEITWIYGNPDKTNKQVTLTPNYRGEDLTFSVNAGSVSFDGTLNEYLATLESNTNGNATYTIVASVTDTTGHYKDISFTFTLKVVRATNAWDEENTVKNGDSIVWTYGGDNKTITILAKYNSENIKFTRNGFDITLEPGQSINDYLASLELSDTTYNIVATVAEDNKYTGLSLTFSFSTQKATNYWIEGGSVPGTIEWTYEVWTYGENAKADDISFKAKELNDKLKFTNNDSPIDLSGYDNSLAQYLKSLEYGTYVIKASVIDEEGNYNDLVATITLSVLRRVNDWDAKNVENGGEIKWTYEDGEGYAKVELTSLYDKDNIVIKVGGNTVYLSDYGNSLHAYLMSLPYSDDDTTKYTVEATVAQNGKYTGISFTFTFIKLKAENKWNADNVTDGGEVNWTYDADNNLEIELTPEYCDNYLTLTVNGNNVSRSAFTGEDNSIGSYLETLNAGEYAIVASVVDGDGHYKTITFSFTLIIAKANNTLGTDYSLNDSIKTVEGENAKVVNSWEWGTEVEWTSANPKYTDGVNIQIFITNNTASEERSFTSSFDFSQYNAMVVRLNSYLSCKSDAKVGSYTMRIVIEGSANWNVLDVNRTFEIVLAENYWDGGMPAFERTDSETLNSSKKGENEWEYSWSYGAPIIVSAGSTYGTYKVVFRDTDKDQVINGMPTDAGHYKAVFSVDGDPTKYKGLAEFTLVFTIAQASGKDLGFDKTPSVSNWTWDGYDVNSNLFNGRPKSGGEVSFEIVDGTGKTVVPEFHLVNANNSNGKYTGNYDADIYAPITQTFTLDGATETLQYFLSALTKGDYYLIMHVKATLNYEGFDYGAINGPAEELVKISIDSATNAWLETPKIASWYTGGFKKTQNSPKADVRYGSYDIVISSKTASGEQGTVWYSAHYAFDERTKTRTKTGDDEDELEKMPAGWFVMTVTVVEAEGKYNGFTEVIEFQVFPQGTETVGNYWTTNPNILGWTANVNEIVNMPTGTPAIGKPYFVFYEAEFDGDKYVKGKQVVAGVDAKTIEKGDDYAQDFYIPMAPGTYLMYAYAVNPANGNDDLVPGDNEFIVFTIAERPINWETSVQINETFMLGDEANWEGPTASTNIKDGTEVIEYYYIDSTLYGPDIDDSLWSAQMPTEVGKYYVMAVAHGRYTTTITSAKMFAIQRPTLSWDRLEPIAPVLRLGEKDKWVYPIATVADKRVKVTFEVFDAKTDEKLNLDSAKKELPTAVGNYYIIVTASADFITPFTYKMEFAVELSINHWVGTSPSIEDWSEANNDTSPKPTGEAFKGTITYTYINKATGKVYHEKPTEAGTYILVATVEVEGYETLESRSEFTIEPAYDRTLLTIDIILAAVASIFAIVVIYFAIRRYREH
ncbi:MAG: hypothetical protein J1F39_00885 [Clostridiales bacterium]|nr:hypothetical protein [Clostridiales bacterium]